MSALERKVCVDCHRAYYSWGAHAEECPGPMQRLAPPPEREPDCGCPPGWHQRTCPDAYWPDNGGDAA